jgi:PIN domain nuclease of toxin-antitoxin system
MILEDLESEEKYVIDTHPFIWYLTGSRKLSRSAKTILERAEKGKVKVILPVIVLFEILDLLERKKQEIARIDEILIWLEERGENFKVFPITYEVFERHLELATISCVGSRDKMIISVALINNTPLITKDNLIQNSNLVECVW